MTRTHFSKEVVTKATDLDAFAIKLNRPTTKLNSERWRENQRTVQTVMRMDLCPSAKEREIRARRLAPIPLPNQTPAWVKEVLAAETANTQWLSSRPPQVWEMQVRDIEDDLLRGAVAHIVWWDWFAQRESGQRWDHLDAYLNPALNASCVPDGVLEEGLVRVGYTPYSAWTRSIAAKHYVRTNRTRDQKPLCRRLA